MFQSGAAGVGASKVTGNAAGGVTVWDSSALRKFRNNPAALALYQAIDELGRGSKVAQGLNNVLTSVERLHDNPNHRLYLLSKGREFIGIIKVGTKKLFIRTRTGDLKEIDPLCVLDFYVRETEQRSGNGKLLYDRMLEGEGVMPHQLGYDRPSPKFIGFLRKHWGLSDYIPQTNNFVVFEQYFSPSSRAPQPYPAAGPAASRSAIPSANTAMPPRPNPSGPPAPIPLDRPMQVPLPSAGNGGVRSAAVHAAASAPHHTAGAAGASTGYGTPSSLGASARVGSSLAHAAAHGSFAQRPQVGHQAMSAALAATLPSKAGAAATTAGPRMHSPTRSGVSYNILAHDHPAEAASVRAAASPLLRSRH